MIQDTEWDLNFGCKEADLHCQDYSDKGKGLAQVFPYRSKHLWQESSSRQGGGGVVTDLFRRVKFQLFGIIRVGMASAFRKILHGDPSWSCSSGKTGGFVYKVARNMHCDHCILGMKSSEPRPLAT